MTRNVSDLSGRRRYPRRMAKRALPGHALLLTALLVSTATPASAQLVSGILGGGGSDDGSLLDLSISLGDVLPPIGSVLGDIANPAPDEGAVPGADNTTAVVTHDAAIAAVRENRALPLADLLPLVQRIVPGQVIDVRLLEIRQALYYEVKVLAAGGVLYLAYFDARTGQFVPQR